MRRRLEPTISTIKVLFAASRNECAHPDCTEPIVVEGVVVGEVCHIHAVHAIDARFDPSMPDDELRSIDNLVLLCHRHHRLIDKRADAYPADMVRQWKTRHESAADPDAAGPERILLDLLEDATMASYEPRIWECAERLHHLLFDSGLFTWSQQPMNLALELLAGIADTEVELLHERLRRQLPPDQRAVATVEQRLWRSNRDAAAAGDAGEHRGGTLARAVFAGTVYHDCVQRLAKLRRHPGFRRHVSCHEEILDALAGTPSWALPPRLDSE